ncbi:Iron-sulfur assembly protein 1 [Lecanicillium sp. MT-2017a]|nr:Iron-sulfur assembly protein 1 [Lecanicillium sp. MT-2017a]
MNVHISLGRAAVRQARHSVLRQFCTSRPACAAFQSYSLPSRTTAPPRNDDIPETSIAYPDPLPKVHETRPPRSPSPSSTTQQQQQKPSETQQAQPTKAQQQPAEQEAKPTQQAKPEPAPVAIPEKEAQKPKATTRPRPKLRPRKAAMKLTPAAVEQLRNMLDQPEPKLIKVGVRNRGCSGLAYHLEYVDKPGAFDEAVEQDGVKVLIDSKALFSIIGSEMDWAEDKLSQRFVFRNPNIKEECGCGESFMV